MVGEMRLAREIFSCGRSSFWRFASLAPNDLYPKVVNSGAGPAVDVRVSIALEPDGPSAKYSAPVMPPGREAGVIVKDQSDRITAFAAYSPYPTLRMKGTSGG
jgi:hypothetical protein